VIRSGVDIIEIERVARAIERHGSRFYLRFFTEREVAESRRQAAALAARFAAKEAVAKALGTGIGVVRWIDIEIVSGTQRQPELRLHGAAARLAGELGLAEWAVSLSHTHQHAVAFAVAATGSPGAIAANG
jgi:holo-[acyl-carrier protein] synthase